jgi:hypothetical protein
VRSSSRFGGRRVLRFEALEDRSLLSVAPTAAAATVTATGDMIVPFHAQIGSSALEKVLGITQEFTSVEQAINAYLNSIPGWHLSGQIDKTPEYTGMVDGSIVIGANGILKSANVTLSGSADIAASIEGYYGISVLHVGVGVAADLSANIQATASYSVITNTWYFGGSASIDGYAKGYASAMAWPLRGEIYVRGDLQANAAISSSTGLASVNLAMVGSIGADAQMKSLFGGWTTIGSVSKTLGSYGYSATFDVGQWLRSEIYGVASTTQAAMLAGAAATTQTHSSSSDDATLLTSTTAVTTASVSMTSTSSSTNASSTTTAAHATALQQLATLTLLSNGYYV